MIFSGGTRVAWYWLLRMRKDEYSSQFGMLGMARVACMRRLCQDWRGWERLFVWCWRIWRAPNEFWLHDGMKLIFTFSLVGSQDRNCCARGWHFDWLMHTNVILRTNQLPITMKPQIHMIANSTSKDATIRSVRLPLNNKIARQKVGLQDLGLSISSSLTRCHNVIKTKQKKNPIGSKCAANVHKRENQGWWTKFRVATKEKRWS